MACTPQPDLDRCIQRRGHARCLGGRENKIKLMPLPTDRAPDESDLIELPVTTQGLVWSLAFSPVEEVLLPATASATCGAVN